MIRAPLLALMFLMGGLVLAPTAVGCGTPLETPAGPAEWRCGADGSFSMIQAGEPGIAEATIYSNEEYDFDTWAIYRTGVLVSAGPTGVDIIHDCSDAGKDGTCDANAYYVTSMLVVRTTPGSTTVCRYVPAVGGCMVMPGLP